MSSSCGKKAQTGEETCENKGLGPSECTAVGCCQYDNAGGQSWSAVGSAPCSSGSGGGSGGGGDGPPRTPATCASDACVGFMFSMTDDALQDMATGLALCTGMYAGFQDMDAGFLKMSVLSTASECGLTSALTPFSLSTCEGATSRMRELMSSCGEPDNQGRGRSRALSDDNATDSDDGVSDNPRTTATCASEACVGIVTSMTDEFFQDITTGIASCPADMGVPGSVGLRKMFDDTASDCNLANALTPLTTCDLLAACDGEESGTVGVSENCYQAVGGIMSGLAPATQSACDNAQQATVSTACQKAVLGEFAACPGSPPPPPPPSPEMPGASIVEAVVFEISVTAAGTVETFDKTGFETNMRSYLGCNEPLCQVAIAVTAGSVNVVATVTDTKSTAVAAAAKLTTDSTAVLSAALGVTVEAAPTVSAATKTTLTIRPPTPTPATPTPTPTSSPAPKAVADAGGSNVEDSSGPIIGGAGEQNAPCDPARSPAARTPSVVRLAELAPLASSPAHSWRRGGRCRTGRRRRLLRHEEEEPASRRRPSAGRRDPV